MPNDDVFTTTPSPTPAPAPVPTPPAPAAPVGLTKADFEAGMQSFARELAAAQQSVPTQPPTPPPPAGSWQDAFFQNPEEALTTKISEVTRPTVAAMARSHAESTLGDFQRAYDAEWYPGAWNDIVEPTLRPVVERTLRDNPLQVVSRDTIQNSVRTLTGKSDAIEKLWKGREAHTAKLASDRAAEEDRIMARVKRETPGLTGGIRLVTGTEGVTSLDSEGKQFVEKYFNATGKKLDEAQLIASMNSGGDYDSWKAASEAAKSKKGA